MKRFLIIALPIIASIPFASPLLAQSRITTNSQMAREFVEISPYDLVTGSYQGRFKARGIPSAGRFIHAVRANKIGAKDLVEVAIAERRLTEETLNDTSYLNHVESILNNLDKN